MKWIMIFFLVITEVALADCNYSLNTPALVYGVTDSNPTVQSTVSITRTGNNGNPCSNFFLAFPTGIHGNYNRHATNMLNGKNIYYNIYKNSNSTGILKGANDIASPDETFFGTINKNQTLTSTYHMTLAPFGSVAPAAGIYLDTIPVQAYSGTYNGNNSYQDTRSMFISIVVSRFTSISLVDSGGIFDAARTSKTLDFGELTTGDELGFDVRVVSNAGYRLQVSSSNNGVMKHVGAPSLIRYNFYSNGSLVGLVGSASSPVTIASGSGVTSADGVRVPIRVVIGSVDSNKSPGTYQDYITLTTITTD
jgi:hypothetical protein